MKIKINKSNAIYWILAGVYTWSLLEHNIYVGLHLTFTNYFPSYLSTFFIISIFIILIILRGERNKKVYFFITFMIVSILISAINIHNREYIKTMFGGMSQIKQYFIIPLGFLCIKEPDKFLEKMGGFSIVIALIHIYTFMNQGYMNQWNKTDYMFFGMEMLVPISLIMLRAFQTRKFIYIICSVIFSFYTMISAHRGVILVIAALLVVYFYSFSNAMDKIKGCFLIGTSAIALYLSYKNILKCVINIMNKYNLSSRTLELLLEGTIGSDSGRDIIWETCIESIKQHVVIGTGIASDRVILHAGVGEFYAHNFVLELMVAFGMLLGTFLVGIIIWMGIHVIRMKTLPEWRNLFLAFYIVSIMTLLTSNSIFVFQPMWIAIIVFCILRKKEKFSNARN